MGLLVCVIVAALVVGRATGGSFERLASVPLRGWPLVLVAVAASLLGALGGGMTALIGAVIAIVCVLTVLVRNRSVEGVPLLAAGLVLNATVIAANGAMPVSLYAESRAGISADSMSGTNGAAHEVANAETRLSVLGDVVPVPLPLRPETVSVGDILVVSGVALLVVAGMHRRTDQ